MKIVFVIGSGRCGSTLLHNMLSKHQDSSFISNIEEQYHRGSPLARYANFFYRGENSLFLKKYSHRFRPTEGYSLINRKVSSIYSRPMRNLEAQDVTPWLRKKFRGYFENCFDRLGKEVLVHKYTGWSRIGFFSEIFPEAKFVHIVRDGRAVANSWLQMPWWEGYQGPNTWQWGELNNAERTIWEDSNQSYVTLAGLCWAKIMDGYRADNLPNGVEVITLQHEQFIKDHVGHLDKILDWIGLDSTADFQKQLANFNVTESRANAFERDLTSSQLEELTNVVSGTLGEFGYGD